MRIGFWAAALLVPAGCGDEHGGPEHPGVTVGEVALAARVCADGPTVEGIDISHWQGTVNWDAIAAGGIAFAYMKATEGTGYTDDTFARNWSEARRVGVLRGAYHYFRPEMDAAAQADRFLSAMGTSAPGDLPPMIDVEETRGMSCAVITAGIRTWADRVRAATGRVPVIYTSIGFWDGSVCGSSAVDDLHLWAAHWGVTCPTIPDVWSDWVFWQYGVLPGVPGISGDVDRDVFNGDLAALEAYAGAVPVCGDGTCTGDETHDTCPDDCPTCEPIPPEGRIVDDVEVCAERVGGADSWFQATDGGYGGSLWWTHAWDDPDPDNQTTWRLAFVDAGEYRVEAYTDPDYAQSRHAPYDVRHDGVVETVVVDQTTVPDGWTPIGDFRFAAGGDQFVHLRDNTGEPYASRIRIAYDAIRLTRLDPPGADADADADEDGGEDGGADAGADADLDGAGDAPDGARADAGDWEGSTRGCDCRVSGAGRSSWLALLPALVALVARRRR
jgi:lysozyme